MTIEVEVYCPHEDCGEFFSYECEAEDVDNQHTATCPNGHKVRFDISFYPSADDVELVQDD